MRWIICRANRLLRSIAWLFRYFANCFSDPREFRVLFELRTLPVVVVSEDVKQDNRNLVSYVNRKRHSDSSFFLNFYLFNPPVQIISSVITLRGSRRFAVTFIRIIFHIILSHLMFYSFTFQKRRERDISQQNMMV